MKVLVTGREGQLARGLLEAADGAGVQVIAIGRPELDLADGKSVAAVVAREHPDVVVNAAAYTAVDKAETEPAAAHAVNALGAEHVARACAAHSVPIIHISTDHVFDGTKHGAYVEDDPTGPINVYGRTKLEGEQRVVKACERHLILRTEWLHSRWGANFVKTMLRLAATRPSISVVSDQLGSPTYAPDLARVVLATANRIVADPAGMRWGIYHAVGGRRDHPVWLCPRGFSVRGRAGAAGGRCHGDCNVGLSNPGAPAGQLSPELRPVALAARSRTTGLAGWGAGLCGPPGSIGAGPIALMPPSIEPAQLPTFAPYAMRKRMVRTAS